MSSTRERRIAKELADIQGDKDNSGVLAQPIDNSDLTHLKGTFPGPPDTPYAGGNFQVDIRIPDMYPFKSPIMKFDTKIWHPNVSSVTVSVPSNPADPSPFLYIPWCRGNRR
jgi:ubiquitin-conjugating enzyme (huntingtin interacting protein 2)